MRICNVCEEEKEESEFDQRKGQAVRYCKDCRRAKIRAHYADNKDYYVKKARKNNDKVRELVRLAKQVPCADCGNSYPYYVMDFDHLGDKSFNISECMAKYGWTKIKAEIDKCDVVCSNCHRVRTHERRFSI